MADPDLFEAIVGQPDAVARLRAAVARPSHAYLFVGPRGSGKRAAAWAFAGEVLAADVDDAAADRFRRLAAERKLADVEVVEPEGRFFRGGREDRRRSHEPSEAERLVRHAHAAPIEGSKSISIAVDFHTANETAVGLLLKSIEEPPSTAIVILLGENDLPDHPTIRSRCIAIPFVPVAPPVIEAHLVAQGVEGAVARSAAYAAGGDVDRARLLATDPELAVRRDLWASIPGRLDGRGAVVGELVSDIRARIDRAADPLKARHETELEQLTRREEEYGRRGSGRKRLIESHNRQMRALREDEIRFGLGTLAGVYRDGIETAPDVSRRATAIERIAEFVDGLERFPNEALQLEALLLDLPPLRSGSEMSRQG